MNIKKCPICNEDIVYKGGFNQCTTPLTDGPLIGISHFYILCTNRVVARDNLIEVIIDGSDTYISVVHTNWYKPMMKLSGITVKQIPETFGRVRKLLIFS